MKFDLPVGNEVITAGYTGKTARIYREQFQSDIMLDLAKAASECIKAYTSAINGGFLDLDNQGQMVELTIHTIGAEALEHFMWAAIYSQNPGTPLYTTWLDGIDDYADLMVSAFVCFEYMIGNVSLAEPENKGEAEEDKADSKKKSHSRKSSV